MQGYLIAFGRRPTPQFCDTLRQIAANEDVKIEGMILTTGPGCYNLAVLLDKPNALWVETLTMVLMPAKYELCTDSKLMTGVFLDEVHGS